MTDMTSQMCRTPINKLKQHNIRQNLKILIVDDDNYVADMLKEVLSDRGHVVTVADGSMSCIGKCQNHQYDVIFMDFHMNDMDGVDTTDLLKNLCHNKSLIFAFTGDDSNNSINKFKTCGMNGAIIKPLDITLINKLMNLLELGSDVDKLVIKSIKNIRALRQLFVFDQQIFSH